MLFSENNLILDCHLGYWTLLLLVCWRWALTKALSSALITMQASAHFLAHFLVLFSAESVLLRGNKKKNKRRKTIRWNCTSLYHASLYCASLYRTSLLAIIEGPAKKFLRLQNGLHFIAFLSCTGWSFDPGTCKCLDSDSWCCNFWHLAETCHACCQNDGWSASCELSITAFPVTFPCMRKTLSLRYFSAFQCGPFVCL